MRLAKLAGQFMLFIVSMAFLTGVSFFMLGAYLASWPIMRISPRDRRVQALLGLGVAIMATIRAFKLDTEETREPATDATEDTETSTMVPISVTEDGLLIVNDALYKRVDDDDIA